MKQTTERLSLDRSRTVAEAVIEALHRYAYAIVEEYARPTDHLLEIGFGEGYGSEIVEPWIEAYVGVEVELDAVKHAAEKYQSPRSSFVHFDGTTLPFEDASFELSISFHVIEHVRDPENFLNEARRVTKADGNVLIVTPNRNHRLGDGERPWNRYHLREYNPRELEAVMRGVFQTVDIFGIEGSSVMNDIEKNRVARARRLARLDPFGLRYVLPEGFDTRLRTVLRRRGSSSTSTTAASQVGIEHVRRTRDDVSASLYLLAVGRG